MANSLTVRSQGPMPECVINYNAQRKYISTCWNDDSMDKEKAVKKMLILVHSHKDTLQEYNDTDT